MDGSPQTCNKEGFKMIIEAFISACFGMVEWIIGFLPTIPNLSTLNFTGIISLISSAGHFVPLDMFVFCIGNIVFWLGVHMAISVLRFVLDFIPFMG